MRDELLRFGPFELDPEREELRRSGLVLRLPRQPLRILLLLAAQQLDPIALDLQPIEPLLLSARAALRTCVRAAARDPRRPSGVDAGPVGARVHPRAPPELERSVRGGAAASAIPGRPRRRRPAS